MSKANLLVLLLCGLAACGSAYAAATTTMTDKETGIVYTKTTSTIKTTNSTQPLNFNNPQDPYENYNRHAYKLNDTLDKIAFKPIATFYQKFFPAPVTKGVSNFFSNLNLVPTIISDALQANPHAMLSDTWRLAINSTVGVGGLFDVASYMDLPPHSEDLGLTFAKWGWHSSAYVVLPILGPSTVRDAASLPIDYEIFSVYPYIQNVALRNSLLGLNFVNKRAELLKFDDVMQQAALDPYVFLRNAYLQRRDYLMEQNTGKTAGEGPDVSDNPVALSN